VELVIPAEAQHARLCRLVASGVATSLGFDYEDIADFRIAVDELVSMLIETTRHSVALRFCEDPDGIVVEGRATGPKLEEPDEARMTLARQILDVVADGYEYGLEGGTAVFRLTKRRTLPLSQHG
jgi:anti-sigma regulatory factor (Ser/Thr protein kinase)